jgi:anaerobic ribonucleoside-triphosphate reductase
VKEKNDKKKKAADKVIAVGNEVYSRVVGYYRPVANWNDGKKEEFKERKYLSWEKKGIDICKDK